MAKWLRYFGKWHTQCDSGIIANCHNCHFLVKIREKLEFLIFRGSKNGPKSNPLGTQEMATFFRVALMLSWGLVVTIQSAAFKLESGLGFDNGPSPAHSPTQPPDSNQTLVFENLSKLININQYWGLSRLLFLSPLFDKCSLIFLTRSDNSSKGWRSCLWMISHSF